MLEPVSNWLPAQEAASTVSGSYWNDEEEEAKKSFWVEDVNDRKALDYIQSQTNLEDSLLQGLAELERWAGRPAEGTALDLGAGVAWATAILAKQPGVDQAYAVDLSRHRLERVAPLIFAQYGAPESKIHRVIGDFTRLRLPDASVGLVAMSQAYHHSHEPGRLLAEVSRVLRPGGMLLISGETPLSPAQVARRVLVYNLRGAAHLLRLAPLQKALRCPPVPERPLFSLRLAELFKPDPVKGDRQYLISEIKGLFARHGLRLRVQEISAPVGKKQKTTHNFLGLKA